MCFETVNNTLTSDLISLNIYTVDGVIFVGTKFRGLNKMTHSWGSKFVEIIVFFLIMHTENRCCMGTGISGWDPPRKPQKLIPHEDYAIHSKLWTYLCHFISQQYHSWLAEQRVRGSNPGLPTLISEMGIFWFQVGIWLKDC